VENQDAIDAAMVGMLSDPKEARDGIEEVHFFPFNPVDKRTALTYIDLADGSWHRVSKGAPEQVRSHGFRIPIYFFIWTLLWYIARFCIHYCVYLLPWRA
jgi:hypothetical protein